MACVLSEILLLAGMVACYVGQIYNPVININNQLSDRYGVQKTLPTDCQNILEQGFNQTGVYTIYPRGTRGFPVRCEMDIDGGGWTVLQRRVSNTDFYKSWAEYQVGFGELSGSFWLGLQQMSMITAQGWYQLRVDMEHPNGTSVFASYNVFEVCGRKLNYTLVAEGYQGTAGDSLKTHTGFPFSTKDMDNDADDGNCAVMSRGAWWYNSCHESNLNGEYGNSVPGEGLNWQTFADKIVSMTTTTMMARNWEYEKTIRKYN